MIPAIEKQTELKTLWETFQEENPKIKIRDAAEQLGVSEGELLATGIGENVVRLKNNFKELLHELHTLGFVMALTRNNEIVHERKGIYENAETDLPHKMALFVNPDIDLRIFLAAWHHAFAAEVSNPRGLLRSIQIFDRDGTAVHKIYLTEQSNPSAYEKLVEKFKSDDQTPFLSIESKPAKDAEKPDSEIDIAGFQKEWTQLEDTHDFFPMLRKFGVAREQALRIAAEEMVRKVPADSFKFVLEEAKTRKLPIMVFVGNDGIIQIHTGLVENVVEARGWFNVMDEKFNLHIDQEGIASAYVVKKPTADGMVTSLEIFNDSGENVALFFGKRKPGIPEMQEWRDLIDDLLNKKKSRN